MVSGDRAAIAQIVNGVGNFNPAEVECALELVDTYLNDEQQRDYRVIVVEDTAGTVCGYACWGPTPLTRGTYDLYWIAVRPGLQGLGYGSALIDYIEARLQVEKGRLLVIETSSKESYGTTVGFYRRLGYEETSRIRDFYDVGDDKLTFSKRFSR